MGFFQVVRNQIQDCMGQVSKLQGGATQLMDTIKGYIPKVQAAWIGGDADEFAADVTRKVLPAMAELIAAFAGVNLNLTKATSAVDACEKKCSSMVSGLADEFAGI